MMRKKNLSSKVFHTLLAMSYVYLGGDIRAPDYRGGGTD